MMLTKILLVDDESLNLALYVEMLGRHSYQFIKASDGRLALEQVRNEKPDLIILDWQMPEMDGLETLIHLKSDQSFKDIPVLMITGVMNAPENMVTALEEGALDFLRKPFDRMELRARVRNLLLLSDSMRELQEKYELLRNRNRLIHSLFNGVAQPMVFYNTEGIIREYNPPFASLFSDHSETLNGKSVYRLFENNQAATFFKKDIELISNNNPDSFESSLEMDGSEFLGSRSVITYSNGLPSGIILVMTDVTEIRRAQEELVEGKKRELVSSALRLIHLTEVNNNLIAELEKVRIHSDPEGKEIIESLIRKYKPATDGAIWQDFETRFENVYESFYRKLHELYPDLTPGERKLCALLRLNITSKDIAAITFQNPQSIDMARYRLRKKLNLSTEENLVDFLQRIQ
jgi:PAS domain S-box-containing protein